MDKLIGYRRFTGKNGKSYCVANVTSDFLLVMLRTEQQVLQ